jgi:hypothetical protein
MEAGRSREKGYIDVHVASDTARSQGGDCVSCAARNDGSRVRGR